MTRIIILFFLSYVFNTCKLEHVKPNIILIIGDDIGWNDFSFHGSNQIPTPNIDALGYNGVFLNRFYTQAICSPSRAALLTGKYPIKIGYQGVPLSCGEDRPIPNNIEILPQKLKKLGYKTHLVGKWHLSSGRRNDTPTRRGFDTHFGYWNGFIGYFDHFAYQSMTNVQNVSEPEWFGLDLHDSFQPQWQYQGQYATELFTKKSLEIINNHNKSEPLFLMVAHLAAHTGAHGIELGVPNYVHTLTNFWYIFSHMRRKYADVVNRLDTSVGLIVKKLQEKDLLKNSVIVFLSDNGAQTIGRYQNYGSNYPFKGLKFTLLEGGVRGSAVLFSPLLHRKGYINNHLMHITDLFATFLKLGGGEPGKDLDGINQWSSISENTPSDRHEILLNIDEVNGYSGILGYSGRYKFLNGSYSNGIYDGAYGETGRHFLTPQYNPLKVLKSCVNQAINNLTSTNPLTEEKIYNLRQQLDVTFCNGKIRHNDLPCLNECLFDLWKDPCETENLIKSKPEIATSLRINILQKYLNDLIPQRNQPVDIRSNPKFYNNTWCTWLDDSECYK